MLNKNCPGNESLTIAKTLGSDGISTEALKHCDFDDIIVKYANKLLIDQEKPDQWSDIHIIPLPKSGDLSKVGNYSGIGISSTISKVINRMILNRIQPAIKQINFISYTSVT